MLTTEIVSFLKGGVLVIHLWAQSCPGGHVLVASQPVGYSLFQIFVRVAHFLVLRSIAGAVSGRVSEMVAWNELVDPPASAKVKNIFDIPLPLNLRSKADLGLWLYWRNLGRGSVPMNFKSHSWTLQRSYTNYAPIST